MAKEAVVALRFTTERNPSASGDRYRRVELQIGKPSDATQSAAVLPADALRRG